MLDGRGSQKKKEFWICFHGWECIKVIKYGFSIVHLLNGSVVWEGEC